MEDLAAVVSDEIRRKEVEAKGTDSRHVLKGSKVKVRVEGGNDIDSGIDTSDSCDETKTKGDRRSKFRTIL